MFVDSTLLVDFLRGKPNAVMKIEQMEPRSLFTSEVNVYELVEGVFLQRENVQFHLEKLFAMLKKLIVLPLDRKAAIKAGEIAGNLSKSGERIGEADSLIAGIALSNGITEIVTENKKHFDRIKELKIISY
jgi:tRNA(fMet)-specific endonuclease VapC